jgi:hypothetical protein
VNPSTQNPPPDGSPLTDAAFIAARAQLVELAAFLDRTERHGSRTDYRVRALQSAAALLCDGEPERARRILEALSDPTTEPRDRAGRPASGAWNAE